MRAWKIGCAAAAAIVFATGSARAGMVITEWMYAPASAPLGEFIEFTNKGPGPVDMSTYNFDDNDPLQGLTSLAAFGMVAANESVILTDDVASTFRTNWGLPASVKIIGGNTNNLGRSDAINLFDGSTLIDNLTYNDQGTGSVAGPRANGFSASIPLANTTPPSEAASSATRAVAGDVFGSTTNLQGDVGNPSITPEPASLGLLACGAVLCVRRRQF